MTAQADNPAVDQAIVSEAITTFFDGKFTDFFAVTSEPTSHELVTIEFYEKRPDLGDIRFLKQVSWNVVVPPDGQLFVATSGLLRDHLNTFWVGWRTPDTLSALSVYQEAPINAPLDPAAKLIYPAIVLPSKKMVHYVWLPKEETWSLYKYDFQGNQGERGSVTRERVSQIDREPVLSAALPIPGADDDRTAVAWIEQADSGIKISAALFSGDSLETLSTPAIPFVTPMPHQRLAMHVNSSGTISVGFIMESRIGGYVVMEVQFDIPKHLFTFHPEPLYVERGTLHSACMFYSKDQHERRSFVCALSEGGVLTVTKPGSTFVQAIREQVDLGYDFPILTSSTGRYEAARSGGKIELSMLP
jgi:hypothetical protein